MDPGKVFHEDERVVMTMWRNMGIVCWRDAPLIEQMRMLRTFSEHLHEHHPGGYGFINVVVSGTPKFSAEVRAEGSAVVKDTAGWGFGTAHIILLQGFLASAVRSFLSTMLLLSRTDEPTKVFGDLDKGLAFIHGRAPAGGPSLEELTAAVLRVIGPRRT